MNLLLDTHAFLWWLAEPERLSGRARAAIADPQSAVRVSAASLWEISIKEALGRIRLGGVDLLEEIETEGFVELPIRGEHALLAGRLPAHHHDPFDRVLVAQALVENFTLVSADRVLERYDVLLLWA